MPALSPFRFKAAIAFILVTALLDIVALGIIIPVLPPLIKEFAGSDANAGWINGVFIALWAGMQFVASPIIGSLSDQYGRRPVILLSTAGLACDYVLMAVAPNLWWLALGRIIAGITSSSFTTAFAYMADITPPEARARGYGLIGAAFSAGFVTGPLLGGVLGEISPRAPFWLAAGMSGLAFVYGWLVLPESLAPQKRMAFAWKRANPFGAMLLLRSHPELSGPRRRELPAPLRPPRLPGGVRALRRLSLRLGPVAGRRAAGAGRHARHDRARCSGRPPGEAHRRPRGYGIRPVRRRRRHRLHGAGADRADVRAGAFSPTRCGAWRCRRCNR